MLGIAFSSIPKTGRGAPALVTPIVLVLQFTSGVFFVFSQLPHWMQVFASFFPLKWLTQGMRSVFLPDSFTSQEVAGSWELPMVGAVVVVPQWLVVGGATELPGATELVGAEVLEFGNVVSTHGAVVGTAVEGALEDGPAVVGAAVVGAAEVLAEAV